MKINRLQIFALRSTGDLVRVTSVVRSGFRTTKQDLCMISEYVNGKTVKNTGRFILSDSLRRRYFAV